MGDIHCIIREYTTGMMSSPSIETPTCNGCLETAVKHLSSPEWLGNSDITEVPSH